MAIGVISAFVLLAGLILMVKSGSIFTDASAAFSRKLRLTELFVGLIVSSIATSAPEFGVSFLAALQHESDICLGNIFGTVVANIGLGFGIALLFSDIRTSKEYFLNGYFMIFSAILAFFLAKDLKILRLEGLLLLFFYAIYLFSAYRKRHASVGIVSTSASQQASKDALEKSLLSIIFWMSLGLIGILFSGKMLIWSVVSLASAFGISKLLMSASVVAVGTSIPEIATAAISAYKKHPELALGVIIGSNIADVLFIVGFSSVFATISVSEKVALFDITFFAFFSSLLLIFMHTGKKLSRFEGVALLALYAFYLYAHIF
ncbi:MAG: calcium/sodium antiporter [Candidatus Methanospirare jalkutatii]|nr:calcium/sodium antiporter [Candidatus Methanospirare jalkutatii]